MATTQLQPVEKPTPPNTVRGWIESDNFKLAVAAALPKHLTPERFIRVALTALMRTPELASCTQESVFKCLLDCSSLGLEPDGRRAHLIPFKKNRKEGNSWKSEMQCQLIIDYKGLAELAYRSGHVSNIHADKVCENDEFEYDRGFVTKHVINFKQDRGKAYAYYCRVLFKDGTEKSEVLSRSEVDEVRGRSKSAENGPWVTDYNEMGKKTAFRRLSKWIPLSPEQRDAVEQDEEDYEYGRPARATGSIDFTALPALTADDITPSDEENRGHDGAAQPVVDVIENAEDTDGGFNLQQPEESTKRGGKKSGYPD